MKMRSQTYQTLCKALLSLCLVSLCSPGLAQESTPKPNTQYKQEYISAYEHANQGKFTEAISAMSKISAGSPFYEQAQKKMSEWKQLLVSRGTSYQKELDRAEYQQALQHSKNGHLVLSIYHLERIKVSSAFYSEAQADVARLKNRLTDLNLNYESAFKQYRDDYNQALRALDLKDYARGVQLLQEISEGSPFYPNAQAQLPQARLKAQAQAASTPRPTPLPKFPPNALQSRHFEFAFQGNLGWSGGSDFSPGAGLGLTYFPTPFLGVHLAPGSYFSENFIMGFAPLSIRYYFDLNHWTPFVGIGAFASVLKDEAEDLRVPLGALAELGLDYRFNNHWAWGIEFNYGLTFSPTMSHTVGANTGLKLAF